MKLVFATRNQGKLRELRQILTEVGGDHGPQLLSVSDFPDLGDVEETGATFAENARIKAVAASRYTGLVALADDSGLAVDALGGRPGVHSARYAGVEATDSERIAKLLGELAGVSQADRTARFVCAIALARPHEGSDVQICEASCEGRILGEPRGHDGFGYDPVFFVESLGCTFAEASAQQKNRLSHRGQAMRQIAAVLLGPERG